MGTHRDWWKPICYQDRSEGEWGYLYDKVTYGLPNWINRCEWIVPTLNPWNE